MPIGINKVARNSQISDSGGSAIPDSVVFYNSGNLNDFDGNAAQYSTTQTNVIEGSHAAEANSSNFNEPIFSESGLPNYPAKGDVFASLLRSGNSGSASGFGFGGSYATKTDYDAYEINMNLDNDKFRIRKLTNGSFDFNLATGSITTSEGEWLDFEVEWHDGSGSEPDNTIVARAYSVDENTFDPAADPSTYRTQLSEISVTDSSYATQTGIHVNSPSGGQTGAINDFYRLLGSV